MFGYIMPFKPEMKIMEYETYRAVYCGICKGLNKRFGPVSRLTLSYDMTFLAVLKMAISGCDVKMSRRSCIAHPFHKHRCCDVSDVIDEVTNIWSFLFYYNVKDKLSDRGLAPRIKAALMYPLAAYMRRKASKKIPQLEKEIKEYLGKLTDLERGNCDSIDKAADCFASLLGAITTYGIEDEGKKRIISRLGYCIGRWIYILDAYNDIDDDVKKHNYNPIYEQYACKSKNTVTPEIKQKIEFTLSHSLAQAAAAYELLDVVRFRGILENIIYLGMSQKQNEVLESI